jgi:hypothetical protein
MTIKTLFTTPFYDGQIDNADLVEELESSCRALARDDVAHPEARRPGSPRRLLRAFRHAVLTS